VDWVREQGQLLIGSRNGKTGATTFLGLEQGSRIMKRKMRRLRGGRELLGHFPSNLKAEVKVYLRASKMGELPNVLAAT
jgi:hypothetical protein